MRFWKVTLYIYSKNASWVRLYQVLDFIFMFFVLVIKNNLLEPIKGNHADGLNVEKVMNQWRLHMVHLNEPANKKIDYLKYNKMMKFYDYHINKIK